MSYVQGDIGRRIEDLIDKSNEMYDNNEFDEAIKLLIDAWNLLPGDKYEFDESFLIICGILDISMLIKNKELMNKWVKEIFLADPERIDSGEREMWAGRIAYELDNFEKAREYFNIANKKSQGRCFWEEDKKYKEFFNNKQINN